MIGLVGDVNGVNNVFLFQFGGWILGPTQQVPARAGHLQQGASGGVEAGGGEGACERRRYLLSALACRSSFASRYPSLLMVSMSN